MKTKPLDFILSSLFLLLIASISIAAVAILTPFSNAALAPYDTIFQFLLFLFMYGLVSALTIQVMLYIKPFSPGVYSMEDSIFTYWKLFTVISEFGKGALLPFTVVFAKPLVAVLFGAKIGRNIALGGRLVDPQLITIGHEAIIGQDSVITAHTITSGSIILNTVKVGDKATVGVNAVIMSGVEVGNGAIVAAGSIVPPNTKIPPNELWGGAPARKIKDVSPTDLRG